MQIKNIKMRFQLNENNNSNIEELELTLYFFKSFLFCGLFRSADRYASVGALDAVALAIQNKMRH